MGRGSHVHCTGDYRCLCDTGYFASSEARSRCRPIAQYTCTAGPCAVVHRGCPSCAHFENWANFREDEEQWKHEVKALERDFPHVRGDENPSYHDCEQCVVFHNLNAEYRDCVNCKEACGASTFAMAEEDGQEEAFGKFRARPNSSVLVVCAAACGVVLLAAMRCRKRRNGSLPPTEVYSPLAG